MNSKFMLSPDGEHIVELTTFDDLKVVGIAFRDGSFIRRDLETVWDTNASILLSGWIELEE